MKKNKIVLTFLLTAAMIFAAGCGSSTKETTQPTQQATEQNETNATTETTPASGQEETQTPSGDGQNGQNGNAQNPFANGNGITGEVTAVGDASITVKDSTGTETEYKVTESTTISKMNVSAGGFNGQMPSGSGDGQNAPQMPSGSGDGQSAPSGFDGQNPPQMPSGSGNGQNPPAGFNGQTPPSGSDGQNAPQMPSGSGDGSSSSGFPRQMGETISLSDITVGNTAMITLADDGSAATIMISDGSFEKPAIDGESGATPTTESAADNGNT